MSESMYRDQDEVVVELGVSADPADVAKIHEFCVTWERAVRTIALYPSTNYLPEEFRQKFFVALDSLLEVHERVVLDIKETTLEFDGHVVYERSGTDENIAYLLFRDGVCQIAFDSGVTREESDRFLMAISDALSSPGTVVDIANQLWQEGLTNIRHYTLDRLVEGAYIEIAADSQIEDRHEQFVGEEESEGEVAGEAEGTGKPPVPYSGVQADRCRYVLDVFGDVTSLTACEQAALAELLRLDSEIQSEELGITILFEILEAADTPRMIEDTIATMEKQLKWGVQAAHWSLVRLILESWRAAESAVSASVARQIKAAQVRAADGSHFDALATYLNEYPQGDLEEIRAILDSYGPFVATKAIGMLGILDHRAARFMVCDFLASTGGESVDLIGNYVHDKRWFVVRNIAKILGEIGGDRAVSFLSKSARHEDTRVRLETIKALQTIRSTAAERALLEFIKDPDRQLRVRTLRVIGLMKIEAATAVLGPLADPGHIMCFDPDEGRELLIAYARVGGAVAVEQLKRLAGYAPFLGRRRWLPVRLTAIHALAESRTLGAKAELAVLTHARNKSIARAAREAMERWERRQRGESEPACSTKDISDDTDSDTD